MSATKPATERREERRGDYGNAVIGVVIALVLYVLSVGPVVRVFYGHYGIKGPPTKLMTAFEIFYGPLIWLDENTALKTPLEWYVGLWVDFK